VILVYQGFGLIGHLAATITGLLVVAFLAWIAWGELRMRKGFGLPFAIISLVALSLVFLIIPPADWLAVGYHLIFIAVVVIIGRRAISQGGTTSQKIANLFVTLTLLVSELYQMIPAMNEAFQLSNPPSGSLILFNIGELLVLLSLITLWWAHGRPAAWRDWLVASLPALALIAMRLANPALTGIIAIWSAG
jgi:hypothetical protein